MFRREGKQNKGPARRWKRNRKIGVRYRYSMTPHDYVNDHKTKARPEQGSPLQVSHLAP